MTLYYSTRDSATAATMRLHGEVGYEIVSSIFCEELNALVADGVTDITVRINSVGGNVVSGYSLFSALTNCPVNVTTINDGLAASTAGWLLLAGKVAKAADYALFMMHNPATCDSSPKALEVLSKMRDSIVTIIAGRTGKSAEEVATMMDNETWLTAEQCLAQGFITEIVPTELLVTLDPAVQNTFTMYQVVNSALGLGAPKAETAAEVTNEVTPEPTTEPEAAPTEEPAATEPAPVEAEAAPAPTEPETPAEEPAPATEEPTATEPEAAPAPAAEVTNEVATQLAELLAQNTLLTERLAAYEAKEAEAARAVVVNRAQELVNAGVKAGKITQASTAHWLTLATNSYDLAKSTLDGLVSGTRTTTPVLNKVGITDPTNTTSLRELEKKNPREVQRLYKEDRAQYNQLYFNQYGKYPVE